MKLWRLLRNYRMNYSSYGAELQHQQHRQHLGDTEKDGCASQANQDAEPTTSYTDCAAPRSTLSHPTLILRQFINPEQATDTSNCNSFDSATTAEEYESCNGGPALGDDRMDL